MKRNGENNCNYNFTLEKYEIYSDQLFYRVRVLQSIEVLGRYRVPNGYLVQSLYTPPVLTRDV